MMNIDNNEYPDFGIRYFYLHCKNGIPKSYAADFTFDTMTVMYSGEMRCSVGGVEMLLKSGDIMFAPRGSKRERHGNTIPSRYYSFNFFQNETPIPLPNYMPNIVNADIREYIDQLVRCEHNGYKYSTPMKSNLLSAMIYNLLSLTVQPKIPYIGDIKRYVLDNYTRKLTLAEVAATVNLAPNYCSTLFSRAEGKSLMKYITEVRIEYAKKLLSYTNMSLAEIASEAGYDGVYYFNRMFKQTTGAAPGRWRSQSKPENKP